MIMHVMEREWIVFRVRGRGLKFKRWKLNSVDDFLFSLKASGLQNLKQIHLPIDDRDSAISLSGLLDIAKACPMLEYLQCCSSRLSPTLNTPFR